MPGAGVGTVVQKQASASQMYHGSDAKLRSICQKPRKYISQMPAVRSCCKLMGMVTVAVPWEDNQRINRVC